MGTSLFDTGEPSAITNMMGLLSQTPAAVQGSGPMPHIMPSVLSSQMPQFAPPPPARQPSLVDRVHTRLQGLLDNLRPSAPQGYDGLLSSDEIQQARPGLIHSLIGTPDAPSPQDRYRANLDNLVAMKQLAMKVADQKHVEAVRQAVASNPDFQPTPGETDSQRHQRMERIGGYLAQNGDYDGAKQIGNLLKDLKDRRFQVAGADLFDLEGPNGPTLLNPREHNPVVGSQEWKDAEAYKAWLRSQGGGRAPALVPIPGPNGPVYGPKVAGQPVYQKPGANGGTPSGQAQAAQARLLGAVSEARAAIPRMDAYEEKMLANPEQATPSLMTQIGGKLATRNAGAHSIGGIVGETVGENATDPDYLQYMRDAGLMARATQLMSSRGGSEAMVSAEQLLNRAVPNAAGLRGSVDAARKSRNAIFGQFGGLMQALTPDQAVKVEAGLKALEQGKSDSPAVETARAVLRDAQSSTSKGNGRASEVKPARVPSYEEWKAANGH